VKKKHSSIPRYPFTCAECFNTSTGRTGAIYCSNACSSNDHYFRYKDGRLIPFVYDIPSNTMLFRDEEVIRKLSQYFGIDITEIKEILKQIFDKLDNKADK